MKPQFVMIKEVLEVLTKVVLNLLRGAIVHYCTQHSSLSQCLYPSGNEETW